MFLVLLHMFVRLVYKMVMALAQFTGRMLGWNNNHIRTFLIKHIILNLQWLLYVLERRMFTS